MSGVLVGFVILVTRAPIETRRGKYRKHIKAKGFLFLNKSKLRKVDSQRSSITVLNKSIIHSKVIQVIILIFTASIT